MKYLPNATMQETENFLHRVVSEWKKETPAFYEFAIILNEKHIGGISVYLDENRKVGSLGWVINNIYHGNGYATEAAKAVMDFAFNTLKVEKVVADCDYRNKSSIKVMQKIGLLLECDTGVRRYKGSDEDIQNLKYSLEVIN
jgi:RimJ/RimL family protein N-acetyltransferase